MKKQKSQLYTATSWLNRCLTVTMGIVAAVGIAATANAKDYGKPGEPVHLTVGYQPYYTQSWSGVVMRSKELWKKYLPEGSTVDFQIGLQGAIIVNAMLAGKQDVGYMGDMPAIVSTTKERVADVRLVGVLGVAHDQCNIFLVRKDAPKFDNPKDALKWLDGKRVAVPKGSCTDRYAQATFKKMDIKPKAYLNQNIEVITSGFKAGKLDAAVIWEPTASKLVMEGIARRVATGFAVDENDGGFLAMRGDLIKQRPDVVKGWLNAELDAQLYLADPKHYEEVAEMATNQTTGFSKDVMWMSLAGKYPKSEDGGDVRNVMPYTFTPDAMELLKRATAFLHEVKSIRVDKLRDDAIMPKFTQDILKERGLTPPVGEIQAQDPSKMGIKLGQTD